ncbi:MAG: hypothetical protein GX085_05885 [Firmicutes bacterium]|nr:hypothetical protein [Bacillota bacterium]
MGKKQTLAHAYRQWLQWLPAVACWAGVFFYLYFTGVVPVIFGLFFAGLIVSFVFYRRSSGRRWLVAFAYNLVFTVYYPVAGCFLPPGLYRSICFLLLVAVASLLLYLFVLRKTGLLYLALFSGGLAFFGLAFAGGEYTKLFPVFLIGVGLWLVGKGVAGYSVPTRAPGEKGRFFGK